MEKLYQKTRAEEIKEALHPFCGKYLNEALENYSNELLIVVQKNRRLNIFKGRKEDWAAAIIYTIARLNFLFDQDDVHYVTPDIICDYYKTKKTSTTFKADQIIEVCKIVLGDKKFSGKNITSMFDYYKTKVGFIVHKSALESRIKNIEALNQDEGEKLKAYVAVKRQLAEKKLKDKLIQRSKKNRNVHKGQLDLFE